MNDEEGYLQSRSAIQESLLVTEDRSENPQAVVQPQSANIKQNEFETSFSAGDTIPEADNNSNNNSTNVVPRPPNTLPLNLGNGMLWMPLPQGQSVPNNLQSIPNGVQNGSLVGIPVQNQDAPSLTSISQTNQGFVVPIPSNLVTPVSQPNAMSNITFPQLHRVSQAGHIYEELPGYGRAPVAPSVTAIPSNKAPTTTPTKTRQKPARRKNPLYGQKEEDDEQSLDQSTPTQGENAEEQALVSGHHKPRRRRGVCCCCCCATISIILSICVSVFALLVAFRIIPLSFDVTKPDSVPSALSSASTLDASIMDNSTMQGLMTDMERMNETVHELTQENMSYQSQLNSLKATLDSLSHCEFNISTNVYNQRRTNFVTPWVPTPQQQKQGGYVRSASCEGNQHVKRFNLETNFTDRANPQFRCNCTREEIDTTIDSVCFIKYWNCRLPTP